jgi:hypothetical protein
MKKRSARNSFTLPGAAYTSEEIFRQEVVEPL